MAGHAQKAENLGMAETLCSRDVRVTSGGDVPFGLRDRESAGKPPQWG